MNGYRVPAYPVGQAEQLHVDDEQLHARPGIRIAETEPLDEGKGFGTDTVTLTESFKQWLK